jgi:tetratricopeptide (TPR) repeat protein
MKSSLSTSIILAICLGWTGFLPTHPDRVNAGDISSCFMTTQSGQTIDLSRICKGRPTQPVSESEQNKRVLLTMGKGIALALQKKWTEAEREFRRVIVLNPRYADAYDALGNTLAAQGKSREAIQSYLRAIELQPQEGVLSASAYNNLGLSLIDIGEIKSGIKALCKATQLDPKFTNPRLNLISQLSKMKINVQNSEIPAFCQDYH